MTYTPSTFEKVWEFLQKRWFEIVLVSFFIGMGILLHFADIHRRNAGINGGFAACESVGMQVGLERVGERYKIVCIEK